MVEATFVWYIGRYSIDYRFGSSNWLERSTCYECVWNWTLGYVRGSDPWYMKRVVDYGISKESLIIDADRAYPMVAINPRPPVFMVIGTGGLSRTWLSGMDLDTSVWWSVASLPAIFGALIVLPIAGLARRLHSNMAGIVAAWLIALMLVISVTQLLVLLITMRLQCCS